MMVALLIGLLCLTAIIVGGWFWHRSRGTEMFVSRTFARLQELNLIAHRLPEPALKHLIREAHALHDAKQDFDPRRLAIRFFGWYATEYKPIDPRAFAVEGAIAAAIPTMLAWAERTPALGEAADREVGTLLKFLHEGFERSGKPKEEILAAQLQLLTLAARQPG